MPLYSQNVPLEYEGFEAWASNILREESSIEQLLVPSQQPVLSSTKVNNSLILDAPSKENIATTNPQVMLPVSNMATRQPTSSVLMIAAVTYLTSRFFSSSAR